MFDTFVQTVNDRAFAIGSLGTAHGFASFNGSNTPAFYSYTSTYSLHDANGFTIYDANGDPQIVHFSVTDPNPIPNGGVTAAAGVDWWDVITLFNPGAAPGSMVSFSISSPLHASFSSTDCSLARTGASNTFEVDYAGSINGVSFGTTVIGQALDFQFGCSPQNNLSFSSVGQAPVGSHLYLSGSFRIRVDGSVNESGVSAIADASNTGNAYLDILTPGAYYVDENGATNLFASPAASGVPEPGTMSVLCVGLAALGLARLKRGIS
jgi:hypothetical protein